MLSNGFRLPGETRQRILLRGSAPGVWHLCVCVPSGWGGGCRGNAWPRLPFCVASSRRLSCRSSCRSSRRPQQRTTSSQGGVGRDKRRPGQDRMGRAPGGVGRDETGNGRIRRVVVCWDEDALGTGHMAERDGTTRGGRSVTGRAAWEGRGGTISWWGGTGSDEQ